ncbi:hypothetical protein Daesc_010393 [Daldinia eschscholtzii]|uniref:Calcium channel YVC1-like C-terminal transmembrane domain-containing protein n=1 Tax=Daldinia eschscholtzii TaxID=292717 RepID=A0AAX6M830_9PEZI
MPIRVKSRHLPTPDRPLSPVSAPTEAPLPDIAHEDAFRDVVKKLSMALRWHYGSINDGRGVSEARANACEIVAWRFLTRLSEREAVEFCLYEIPDNSQKDAPSAEEPADGGESNERSALLHRPSRSPSPDRRSDSNHFGSARRSQLFQSISKLTISRHTSEVEELQDDPTEPFTHLNALEIAAIADAKRFLSQHVVQKIITGIWNGEIIFWDRLSVHSEKKPRFYNPSTADPFSRLRVPKYLKAYEVGFFVAFLMLYYSVLIEQNRYAITPLEILLYVWFAAFFYDEVSEYLDAGSVFYAADVWNLFDMIMIAIGIVFAVLRFIGLYKADYTLVDIGFDVLSLEALFMVPRVCSIFSLSPYWGTLIPCLKEMAPFNLIALGIFRPLRLFLPSDDKFRQARILLLRATHAPIVGAIQVYEWFTNKVNPDGFDNFRGPRQNSFKRHAAPPADRPESRPQSGYRPRMPMPRATSAEVIHKPRPRQRVPEDYAGEAPSDVEVRISELTAKIDRLTALVVALQSGAGIETVRT